MGDINRQGIMSEPPTPGALYNSGIMHYFGIAVLQLLRGSNTICVLGCNTA